MSTSATQGGHNYIIGPVNIIVLYIEDFVVILTVCISWCCRRCCCCRCLSVLVCRGKNWHPF